MLSAADSSVAAPLELGDEDNDIDGARAGLAGLKSEDRPAGGDW